MFIIGAFAEGGEGGHYMSDKNRNMVQKAFDACQDCSEGDLDLLRECLKRGGDDNITGLVLLEPFPNFRDHPKCRSIAGLRAQEAIRWWSTFKVQKPSFYWAGV